MTTGREKTCVEVAAARGRRARARALLAGGSPLRGEVLYGVMALSSFMALVVMLPFRPRRHAPFRGDLPERPIPRELGVPGPLFRPRTGQLHGRYGARPSIERIMRDLRRPAARDAALAALLARLGGDLATGVWVQEQADADDLRRLMVSVRPGMSEVAIIEAWRSAAAAELAALDGAGTELASTGPARF